MTNNTPDDPMKIFADLAQELSRNTRYKNSQAVQGTTNRPYYREGPAIELRAILDNLVRTRATQVIPLDPACNFDTHRNKFSQAKKYLLENLDPEKYYFTICNHITIDHKDKTKLTYIKFKSSPMLSCSVPDFTTDLENAIRTYVFGEVFERTGLNLNDEQLSHFQHIAAGLDNSWVSIIDKDRIIFGKAEPT